MGERQLERSADRAGCGGASRAGELFAKWPGRGWQHFSRCPQRHGRSPPAGSRWARAAVGKGRGGRDRGSGQPVPGPPGEAAGYFYPVVFAECAADLPSGARKFPPSASFPFPPFPVREGAVAGGGRTADRGGGGWGARAGTLGGAAAHARGSGTGEQVSEPSLISRAGAGGPGRGRRGSVPCWGPERRRPRSTSPREQRRSEGEPGRRAKAGSAAARGGERAVKRLGRARDWCCRLPWGRRRERLAVRRATCAANFEGWAAAGGCSESRQV